MSFQLVPESRPVIGINQDVVGKTPRVVEPLPLVVKHQANLHPSDLSV